MGYYAFEAWPILPGLEPPTGAELRRRSPGRLSILLAHHLLPISRFGVTSTLMALLSLVISACSFGTASQPTAPSAPTADYSADRFFATAEPACQKYWMWIDYSDLVQSGNDRARLCDDWLPWAKDRVIPLEACWEALPEPVGECLAMHYTYSRSYIRILHDIVEEVDGYCFHGGDLDQAFDWVKIAGEIWASGELMVRDCYDRK